MKRAAIYARFSSDRQKDRSIEDQIILCRDLCARADMQVVSTFEDRQISGSAAANRPGFQALMRAAEAQLFDTIVAEDVDRLCRSQADYHAARRRLDFAGISIHTATGDVGKLDGALRALMGEHYLENLALHTRRGMAGIIRDGRHAGGRAYGYRAVAGKPGELEIVEEEAIIIRRIFDEYVAGETPNAIAIRLNAERVTPPRGRFWRSSTLLGSKARGHGILHNEVYAGRIVWNRVRMMKDPETGKRISRVNPQSEWQRADAPHLRIVAEDVFNAAQTRREQRTVVQPKGVRKLKYLLSGLLRCGACGSGMEIKDKDCGRLRIRCANARHGGGCDNSRAYHLDRIERAVIDGLKKQIGSKEAISYFVQVFNEEQRRQSAGAAAARAKLEVKLADAQRGVDRLVDAIADGVITKEEARERMPALRAELAAAKAALASSEEPPKVVAMHPRVVDQYLRDLDRLDQLIADDLAAGDDGLAKALREIVTKVTVMPAPAREAPLIRIGGYLETLLNQSRFDECSAGGERGSGGPLYRETHYFESSVFLSAGSVIGLAEFLVRPRKPHFLRSPTYGGYHKESPVV
jgi:site-specific DNA recombinase